MEPEVFPFFHLLSNPKIIFLTTTSFESEWYSVKFTRLRHLDVSDSHVTLTMFQPRVCVPTFRWS